MEKGEIPDPALYAGKGKGKGKDKGDKGGSDDVARFHYLEHCKATIRKSKAGRRP